MHKVIYLIVEADSEELAWTKLGVLRDIICDEKQYYDYGTFFNEDSPVSGASRWGKLVPIAKLNSKEGRDHVDNALAITQRQFIDALKEIKKAIDDYTEKELYDGKVINVRSKIIEGLKDDNGSRDRAFELMMFRYHLRQMTDDERYGWLYILESSDKDNWVEGFENKIEFTSRMEGKDKNKTWIAPMDVHF